MLRPNDGRVWHNAREMYPPVGYHLLVSQKAVASDCTPLICEAYSAELTSVGPLRCCETIVTIGRSILRISEIDAWAFHSQSDERAVSGLPVAGTLPRLQPVTKDKAAALAILTQEWLRKFRSADPDHVGEAMRAVQDFVGARLMEVVSADETFPMLLNLRVPFTVGMCPDSTTGDLREKILAGLIELFKKANER